MIEIEVGAEKFRKPSKGNAILFVVVEGALYITIQNMTFPLRKGGHFMVPRG